MAPELQNALSDLEAKDAAFKGLDAQVQSAAALLDSHAAAKTARQQAIVRLHQLLADHYPEALDPAPVPAAGSFQSRLAARLSQQHAPATAHVS